MSLLNGWKLRLLLLNLLLLTGLSLRAATATPVPVSSTTVATVSGVSTVTVTTGSAHNLTANNGFCNHTAATPYCSVVATVPNSTTFTYTTTAGVTACSTSCGGIVPSRRVIWTVTGQNDFGYNITAVLWTFTTQPVAQPGFQSAWSQIGILGSTITTEETAALVSGNFIEHVLSDTAPSGTNLQTEEARLQLWWTAYQSQLSGSVQPGQFYGDSWDSIGWVQ